MTPPRATGAFHGWAVARIKGTSVHALIIDALKAEIERVRQDEDFTSRAKQLLERDRELLERLRQ